MKRVYKLKPDKYDANDYIYKPKTATNITKLSNIVDLRSQCSPIVDQGELGSCTANAIVSGLREYLLLQAKQPWIALSRLFLYYEERLLEGTVNEDDGAKIRDGMKVLKNIGVCLEAEDPYNINKFTNPPTAQNISAAIQYKITSYQRVVNLAMLKTVLTEGLPVVIGIEVYSSFESEAVNHTGIVSVPDIQTEDLLGAHAVLVVGYDDINQWAIVRNSWGINWGDQGYFYLPYQYWTKNLITDMWTGK
jgi:C1A family cysteine protease